MRRSGERTGHGPAIVTLTMNPALDITTSAPQVRPTSKIRCVGARYDPGGGGINVARTAHVLGESVSAVFPVGGPTGDLVTELLGKADVPFRRIAIGDPTRESFTVNDDSSGQQYRFVLPGPCLTAQEQAKCLEELRFEARAAQFVVASGSLPPGVPSDFYQRVADICRDVGARLILDTSGDALQSVHSGVFLLKASVRELRERVGRDLLDRSDQLTAAQELIAAGVAEIIVVSLGSEGALLATSQGGHHFPPVPVEAVSGVGAGDAMVAAIAVGLTRGWSPTKSVQFGVATGAAMLLTPGTEVCARADVERLFEATPEPEEIVG
ncbi:1-phosphofructokinase family hexose kinase [Mycolicibacterium monacense]|uniref:ATP-dependent 6-phosphofructokinase isozyme 2 n=4 Tax=Mycobacteriaceae TaxID=1762 RepID=A0AAD1J068_MYCMB|nr:1-phosphofructokinase family hexose kinase [Mycolicibacterium monacense]MDA4102308.1 phosphofructokinase [Mycolicibacterium monacense DSM 44395]OBB70471.1 phosphofructokinase [Mycolicibacterium monacense]OBF52193.1 phosphofructokinase [Mycolicibacterium monacense]ORB15055.1 phosphofructokinase [Mycolicibacterium monacense DSM 44395]QHP87033.1 1-phosphofructokinase family hexose kinase [Mycolicibacterium monacense DSM 44395]